MQLRARKPCRDGDSLSAMRPMAGPWGTEPQTFRLIETSLTTTPTARSKIFPLFQFKSDDQVVRVSASGAVHLDSIPSRFKPMTVKLVFIASLFDAQH